MKNFKLTILTTTFLLLTSILVAQTPDSVYIVKNIDEMSDKVYFYPSRKMICASQDKSIGFSISMLFKDNGSLATDLIVKTVNIGLCSEQNKIIFLFEDLTKISIVSWNEFNCKGDAWFVLSNSDKDNLANKKVKKIKFQNGKSFESYTYDVIENNDYFIQLFCAIRNKNIKLKTIN
ncbi:MAG: hypothetical protein EXR20_04915 [Bacteroidetes bacterium]|jgi:hypothetical protein|nr:hypothetical protein [Bacteroidota bacterium]